VSYHSLANDTGGNADDRRSEADRIIQILSENIEFDSMKANEQEFVGNMQEGGPVSPKQIFWLRDIKEKYTH
jgi:hypothetical protein